MYFCVQDCVRRVIGLWRKKVAVQVRLEMMMDGWMDGFGFSTNRKVGNGGRGLGEEGVLTSWFQFPGPLCVEFGWSYRVCEGAIC